MRCIACDALLTDYEATRRGEASGDFLDLCSHCFETIQDQVRVIDRPDLRPLEFDDEPWDEL